MFSYFSINDLIETLHPKTNSLPKVLKQSLKLNKNEIWELLFHLKQVHQSAFPESARECSQSLWSRWRQFRTPRRGSSRSHRCRIWASGVCSRTGRRPRRRQLRRSVGPTVRTFRTRLCGSGTGSARKQPSALETNEQILVRWNLEISKLQ